MGGCETGITPSNDSTSTSDVSVRVPLPPMDQHRGFSLILALDKDVQFHLVFLQLIATSPRRALQLEKADPTGADTAGFHHRRGWVEAGV